MYILVNYVKYNACEFRLAYRGGHTWISLNEILIFLVSPMHPLVEIKLTFYLYVQKCNCQSLVLHALVMHF